MSTPQLPMDPLSRDSLDDERRKRLKQGAPKLPPLPVPPGGGAAGTPYPDYEITRPDKWALDWDPKTRAAISRRVNNVPRYRFFGAEEVTLLETICTRALPQTDRAAGAQIPIAPYIDARLYLGEGEGYHYGDMPPDGRAYKYGLAGIEETARALYAQEFGSLTAAQQDAVLQEVADGSPPGRAWRFLSARRFFQLLLQDVITIYYGHPAAWAEIGFQGPASPRGHIRLGLGKRDPWEAKEQRPRSSTGLVRRALARQTEERDEDLKSGEAR